LRAAVEQRRHELMESLSPEGKAIYETVSASQDKFKANINALIISAVNSAVATVVDATVERAVDKAVAAIVSIAECNMQAYVDGLEEDLRALIRLKRIYNF
jgi:phage baseplate assembly protein W